MLLSRSEERVVKLVVQGLSNREIANELSVSEKTIKFHLTEIYKKLEINSRAQLIVKYLRADSENDEFFTLMRGLISDNNGLSC